MGSQREKWLSIILISCLGMIIYSNTWHSPFQFDDYIYIVNNFFVRDIGKLQYIWTYYPCRFITFLSIALNYQHSRLDVFGYHIFNIAVHLGSAILVWWLTLLTLTTPVMKEDKIQKQANLLALCAGLVFVSHPVQTEAVTYIYQRAASLAAFFYLASLCFYVKSRLLQDRGPGSSLGKFYYISSLIMAVAAMFTKENAITLPLMILLYEMSFFKTSKDFNWRGLFPFLLTLLIIPLTMWLTKSDKFQEIQGIAQGPGGISPFHYLLTQFRVMVTYLRLSFLPIHQALDYDYPVYKSILEIPVLCSFLFLMLILFTARRLFSKYRLVSFSMYWFFLTLLPESSLLPFNDVIFEHRLYLPLAGYSLFLVGGAYYLLGRNNIRRMVSVMVLMIAFYSMMTYQRNNVWRDEFTLWNDALQKSPHKARAYYGRGDGNFHNGRLAEALSDYSKAIDIAPYYLMAYDGRGIVHTKLNQLPEALSDFDRAIKIYPGYAKAYNDRGAVYTEQGRFIQANSDYDRAIALNPNLISAYYNRGLMSYKQGHFDDAVPDFSRCIEQNLNLEEAYIYRGQSYDQRGYLEQAMSDYNKAIELDPYKADIFFNRAVIYDKQGHLTQALSDYNKAIGLNSDYAKAYARRGVIFSKQHNLSRAMLDYDKAIDIDPSDAEIYFDRAITYTMLKKYDNAWADVYKAKQLGYRVNPGFMNDLKTLSGREK
jgi:tetratricopeptide (TPR) repeat protein